ncbi:unnamed protein product [Adineta ricciae]|uniref:Uncharacterized protein n=1 Tax=Adineta ricciae TaxID=249248 RepID=A0A814JR93_ADIRI|nr:unnamed protein product [Adineta ricciae]
MYSFSVGNSPKVFPQASNETRVCQFLCRVDEPIQLLKTLLLICLKTYVCHLNFIVAALNAIPIPTDFNDGFYEKLIVWKVDEHIPSRIDFQQLSNELQDRHIPLVFVTEVTPDFQTWDLYRETARNTGGEYLLLPSDPTALRRAISSAINGEDTLRQAFLHLRTQQNAAATSRPTDANEQTQGADNDLIFPFD